MNPKLQDIFEILKSSGKLPSPKGPALAVVQLTRQDNMTSTQLVRAIQSDPALVARLLKLANACLASGVRPVLAIHDAIGMLGLNAVRGLALGFSLMTDKQSLGCRAFNYPAFWSHNLARAVAMHSLVAASRMMQSDEAFTLGLLSHIGELGLASAYPEEYGRLLGRAPCGSAECLESERQAFGLDHAELTVALMADWGFPPRLIEPVGLHERPEAATFEAGSRSDRLLLTLVLAAKISDVCMAAKDTQQAMMTDLLLHGAKLSIGAEELMALSDGIVREWSGWCQLLEVPSFALPPFAELIRAQPAAVAGSLNGQANAVVNSGFRVLLVDADSRRRNALKELLTGAGYVCCEADHGGQGLECVRAECIDLMIVDWQSCAMDGIELISALRSTARGRAIYLLLTHQDQEDQVVDAFAAGADDFLSRPFRPNVLLARMMAGQRVVSLHRGIAQDQTNLQSFSTEFARLNQRLQEGYQKDKANQKRMELALQGGDLGMWELEIPNRKVILSERSCTMLGYLPNALQLNIESWRQLVHPDDWASTYAALQAHLKGQTPSFESEHRFQHKNGQWVWILDRAQVVERDAKGLPLRVVGTYMDITQRKQAEDLFRKSERRFRHILEHAPIGMATNTMDGHFILVNHAFCAMLGYEKDELEKMSYLDITYQEDRELTLGVRQQLLNGEIESFQMEKRYRRKDGRPMWGLLSSSVECDESDEPYFIAQVEDISARKASEAQLRKLSLAVEQSSESIVITNLAAEIEYVNAAFIDNTGYGRDEAIGQNPRILHSGKTPPETFAELWSALTQGSSWRGELYNQRKDGSGYVESVTITPLRQPDGVITHYVAVKEDITERKQKEEELRQAKEMAESANRAKSRFLATMSHEIRTPMNGILGMAEMLLLPDLTDDERQDYAQTILSSGESLLRLLNDILDFSKIEAGKIKLESTEFEPGQILHGIHKLFAESAQQKGLRIESVWCGADDERYLGDPHYLYQMMSNLVGNAVKFTARGAVCIEAREINRDREGATLEFSVSDTGIGIAQEKLSLLFKPFSQTDSSTTREYGGSGLGLSIVSSLAQLMGGHAGVESEAGQGARFWFRIRVGCPAAVAGGRETATHDRAPSCKALTGRILVVEDTPTNRKVVKAMLGKTGLHCEFVEDGRQAVEAITSGQEFDLVLMDCLMPVMDGFEATQRIRRWEMETARPRVAIVALTAGAYEEDRERCIRVGMDDFLAKPYEIEKLFSMLGRWLRPASSATALPH